MTYVLGWFGLVTISLAISLAAFVWALKNGQFSEQHRLRYLPLRDEECSAPGPLPARCPPEVRVLIGIGLMVGTIYLAAVVIAVANG